MAASEHRADGRRHKIDEMTVPAMDTLDRDNHRREDDLVADHDDCAGHRLVDNLHPPTEALASKNHGNDSNSAVTSTSTTSTTTLPGHHQVPGDANRLTDCKGDEDVSTKTIERDGSRLHHQKLHNSTKEQSTIPDTDTTKSPRHQQQQQDTDEEDISERKDSLISCQSDGDSVFSGEPNFYFEEGDLDDDDLDSDADGDFLNQYGNDSCRSDSEDDEKWGGPTSRDGVDQCRRGHSKKTAKNENNASRSSSSSRAEARGTPIQRGPASEHFHQASSVPSSLHTMCRRHSHSGHLVFRCQVSDSPDSLMPYSSSPPYFSPKWPQAILRRTGGNSDAPTTSGRRRRNTVAYKGDVRREEQQKQSLQDHDPTSENFTMRSRSYSESDVQRLLMKQMGSELRRISDEFNLNRTRRGKLTTVSESASEND